MSKGNDLCKATGYGLMGAGALGVLYTAFTLASGGTALAPIVIGSVIDAGLVYAGNEVRKAGSSPSPS